MRTASNAAEYLKFFNNLSYGRSLRFLLASILISFISPTGFAFAFPLPFSPNRPVPIDEMAALPRKDSKAPERREEMEKGLSRELDSEALGCLRRTESVPSDIPAAMCVSSGCTFIHSINITQSRKVNESITYGDTKTENGSRVPHSMHDFIRAHVVHFDHMVQPAGEQSTGFRVERK